MSCLPPNRQLTTPSIHHPSIPSDRRRWLVAHGGDIAHRDNSGHTLLHLLFYAEEDLDTELVSHTHTHTHTHTSSLLPSLPFHAFI